MSQTRHLNSVGQTVTFTLTAEQAETLRLLVEMYVSEARFEGRPVPSRIASLHTAVKEAR